MDQGGAINSDLAERPLAILGRPWFWCLFIGGLWGLPLLRALSAELPDPVPGHESPAVSGSYVDEFGRTVTLAGLQGHLVIVGELPMNEEQSRESAFQDLRVLRKRVRGLSPVVTFAVFVRVGDSEALSLYLDEKRARKPSNVFLLDEDGTGFGNMVERGGDPEARFFLLDRHGRMRGAYRVDTPGMDQLAEEAGQLANWIGSDPPPGEPIRR
ncbi:hypothetical protein CMO84_01900 [Candidatus Woesearchaeota archaeon]|nr:hypothetical protein [Candidatus Woesearchaeota archaeon]MDP6741287.1 hypothetical protein [Planctomycetota bacterium]MDP6938834.1 hypothetical protein [Planctomycetota bacterium]